MPSLTFLSLMDLYRSVFLSNRKPNNKNDTIVINTIPQNNIVFASLCYRYSVINSFLLNAKKDAFISRVFFCTIPYLSTLPTLNLLLSLLRRRMPIVYCFTIVAMCILHLSSVPSIFHESDGKAIKSIESRRRTCCNQQYCCCI